MCLVARTFYLVGLIASVLQGDRAYAIFPRANVFILRSIVMIMNVLMITNVAMIIIDNLATAYE